MRGWVRVCVRGEVVRGEGVSGERRDSVLQCGELRSDRR